MKSNKPEATKPEAKDAKPSYQRPELKKHGKLKSKASHTVYTYYFIVR